MMDRPTLCCSYGALTYLNSLPPCRNSVVIAELVEDALRRDSNALALERGVSMASRLWSTLTDLPRTEHK